MSASSAARIDQIYPPPNAARGDDALSADEFGLITRGVTLKVGAETGVLTVFNQTDRVVQVLSAWGATTVPDPRSEPLNPDGGFVGRVLESGRTTGEAIDAERDATLGIAASGARIAYAMGAAIRPPGGPPGALCVGFSARPQDMSLALWCVESYARLASLCLHEAGTFDGLLAAAHLDGLTGCLNYAAVRAELDREIQRSERHGRPVSCCFIDLDHFKRVNDLYGHLYGNRVLSDVAAILRHGVRTGDTVGRYGGDEFLAILPDADETAACALGERLRSQIWGTKLDGTDERLDVSIGVAEWRPGLTADDLLGAADKVLLRAKDGGGGWVVGSGGGTAGAGRRPHEGARVATATAKGDVAAGAGCDVTRASGGLWGLVE